MKQTNWFPMFMLALGIILGGFGGVLRGDWLGRQEALEVKEDVNARIDREVNNRLDRMEAQLNEILKELRQR